MEQVRHPKSAPGDFYVVNNECLSCGVPHAVAPDLVGWADDSGYSHCYWKKQPENDYELNQAFAIFDGQEAGCHRYAGHDLQIQQRIGKESCDYPVAQSERFFASMSSPSSSLITSEEVRERNFLHRLWSRLFKN